MSVKIVQYFEYTTKFNSAVLVDNSFVFSTNDGFLITEIQSDIFRPTADYKVLRTMLAYSKAKPFEDKNYNFVRFQRPVSCSEKNIMAFKNYHKWSIIYMTNNSNIVFLEKCNGKWLEKLSDIPQKWFLLKIKDLDNKLNLENMNPRNENTILIYSRDREKEILIKNFVCTHLLKIDNGDLHYGTICCHLNNSLTFWSSINEHSTFLKEFKYCYSCTTVKYVEWFQVSNSLSWLMVFLNNGQIYVHEFVDYPNVENTFILWSNEDHVITKMAFIIFVLYSLTKKEIIKIKKETIKKTLVIPGFTVLNEKNLIILVTDAGKFISIQLTISDTDFSYVLLPITNDFNDQVQNFTCTSAVFSQNKCTCVLSFEYNIARYSKKDILKKNKLLFCVIPESLIELEQKILSVENDSYSSVIDCIETLRVNRMNDIFGEQLYLDRKFLDTCSTNDLKLIYWKTAFKNEKKENEESLLSELQTLVHTRFLIERFAVNNNFATNTEKYYSRVMLTEYFKKIPKDYVNVRKDATNLISLLKEIKHTHSCSTCHRILTSFTDFRMFICEQNHKELRCPVTLGPLGVPYLVCSMCSTMANKKLSNEKCVWCFGKYTQNELQFYT
ncbi:uncharacterized protein LOC126905956 isoform X2 [Daktulosphaira vitifoliae]|uniref:uncharacterized protein LOC126905956 isoform X2 n=1 Tax=Daktulosphaira vitifoliae TaxID=58002 RepID=UPI0021A9B0C9|nr:uncharacterized protein LOC126905956 isoform X2 [Daktulosphaira vitifoliae]